MITSIRVEKPEEVVFTIEIKLSLRDWKSLKQQLDRQDYEWPGSKLREHIGDLILDAESKLIRNADRE